MLTYARARHFGFLIRMTGTLGLHSLSHNGLIIPTGLARRCSGGHVDGTNHNLASTGEEIVRLVCKSALGEDTTG